MPVAIRDLASQFLLDPKTVSVKPAATTAERVDQYVTFCNQSEKQALLTITLGDPAIDRALVFTRTKHGADRVVKLLAGNGIASNAIHGNKSQGQRERALGEFKQGKVKVLIATDIAARGIDVSGVSHVINFELPNVAEQYVHRIGRTARAGGSGIAIAFVADDERPYLKAIEKLTRIKLDIQPLPENFVAEKAKLPKPAPSVTPTGDRGRRHDGRGDGGRGAEGQPKRHFSRPKGAPGAHKGAVRKFNQR
jgi:ATP-dependent RNA helicase RhlE